MDEEKIGKALAMIYDKLNSLEKKIDKIGQNQEKLAQKIEDLRFSSGTDTVVVYDI